MKSSQITRLVKSPTILNKRLFLARVASKRFLDIIYDRSQITNSYIYSANSVDLYGRDYYKISEVKDSISALSSDTFDGIFNYFNYIGDARSLLNTTNPI